MNILGIFSTHGAQAIGAVRSSEATQAATAAVQPGVGEVQDSVTLSADIRFDKVNAIRAAIADGSYETPEKLDLALDRLLDRLG
ncbi:MAG: flagellar biosynthesis anti-sigma factor FlgM [Planctomycetia bacterium]|nr:flagellar biosynthesis anti-sigma factor FlgM [Planctomycetia bacterium]